MEKSKIFLSFFDLSPARAPKIPGHSHAAFIFLWYDGGKYEHKEERTMRILVVEDQPEMNALLVKQLTAAHYSVDGCLNGNDALEYLAGG